VRFKNRAPLDIIVCGVGAGIIPFLIGVQTAPLLTLQLELPWMPQRYQDTILAAIPIFLIQCAGQVYQVIGDHEADALANVNTFAVKYGKKTSLRFASGLLLTTISLPIIFELLNLSLIPFLDWYLIAFAFLVPCLIYFMKRTQDASPKNFKKLREFAKRAGMAILFLLILYVLIVRMAVKGL
jgi:4-hydroxybenzoate polyprenyltransferase